MGPDLVVKAEHVHGWTLTASFEVGRYPKVYIYIYPFPNHPWDLLIYLQ